MGTKRHRMTPSTFDSIRLAKKKITEALWDESCRAFLIPKRKEEYNAEKTKRPCSYPGCPNLTDGRFCEEHAKEEARRYEHYDRDPATKRRYGRAWKRIRDSYAAAHPLCEECLAKGVYTPTEEIHHMLPLSQGGTHDRENLKALCKSCHARIHAERGDRWHNTPGAV